MTPEIGVVVVTHRSQERLRGLLASLTEHEPDTDVVVVDSGTPEGPPAAGVPVLPLEENVGFGAACNHGVEALRELGQHDAYCFLNPDILLAGPSLSELSIHLDERDAVGVATGPVTSPTGQREPSAWGPTSALRGFWFATGWRLPRLRRLAGRLLRAGTMTSSTTMVQEDVEVDGHVLGGAMMVSGECWDELGGFDESYFLYWEDADLCHRARTLGWKVAVLPCTPIIHDAGTSSRGVDQGDRWRWYMEGAMRFAQDHLSNSEGRRLLRALQFGRWLRRR